MEIFLLSIYLLLHLVLFCRPGDINRFNIAIIRIKMGSTIMWESWVLDFHFLPMAAFQVTQARERNRNRKLASLFQSKKKWGSAEDLAPIEEERTAPQQLALPPFRPRKFSRWSSPHALTHPALRSKKCRRVICKFSIDTPMSIRTVLINTITHVHTSIKQLLEVFGVVGI